MSSSNSSINHLEFRKTLMMGNKTLKWRPNSAIEVAPSCPRCFSSNTKFCYYNNYSVSQPRYFCKACRRYWTKGGSLRNVPIGGGCRKTTRASARRDPSPSPPAAAESEKHVVKDYECSNFAAMFECGGIDGGDEQLGQVYGSFHGRDLVYENLGVFEVEGIGLGSEMFPNLEGFGCGQPPLMEMQEFHQVFSSGDDDIDDHRLRMSYQNLISDNWASFDLSPYENF